MSEVHLTRSNSVPSVTESGSFRENYIDKYKEGMMERQQCPSCFLSEMVFVGCISGCGLAVGRPETAIYSMMAMGRCPAVTWGRYTWGRGEDGRETATC